MMKKHQKSAPKITVLRVISTLYIYALIAMPFIYASNAIASTLRTSILPSITNIRVSESLPFADSSDVLTQTIERSTGSDSVGAFSVLGVARARIGDLGILASSDAFSAAPTGNSSSITSISALAEFTDTLYLPMNSGFIDFSININGALSDIMPFTTNGLVFQISSPDAPVVSDNGVTYRVNRNHGGFSPTGEPLITISESGALGTSIVRMAFNSSSVRITSRMEGVSSCRTVGRFNPCFSETNFFSSATFVGAVLFDAEMNAIANAVIGSESGFDYSAGISQTAAVPIPAALPLLATGLVSLFGLRRWRTAPA